MARRNKRGQFVKGSGGGGRRKAARRGVTREAITVRMAAPVAKTRTRTRVVKVAAPRRRRSSSGGGVGSLGGLTKLVGGQHRTALLLGALALGYAHQQGWLAKLPLLGKAGPVTSASLLGWGAEELLHVKLPKIASDAITAGLVISSFNVGNTIGSPGGTQLVGDAAYPGGAVFYNPAG